MVPRKTECDAGLSRRRDETLSRKAVASALVIVALLIPACSAPGPSLWSTEAPGASVTEGPASTVEPHVDLDPTDEARASPAPETAPTPTCPSFGGARFEIEAPFSTATVEIGPDGTVRYEASSPDTGIEKETGSKKVSEDEIARLVEAVREAQFFSPQGEAPPLGAGSGPGGAGGRERPRPRVG